MSTPLVQVGIVMGSDSDWPTMKAAAEALEEFGIGHEADVVSAHRMPEEMLAYGKEAAAFMVGQSESEPITIPTCTGGVLIRSPFRGHHGTRRRHGAPARVRRPGRRRRP